jgi:L-amino acid N-acyltransferase YncA
LLTEKGFAAIRNTVRTDTEDSIRLHEKLGFDCVDRYTTERGRDVFVFSKEI